MEKKKILMLILLLALALRLYHINSPFTDHHSWKQTEIAMVARNYYSHGFNILNIEMDYLGKSTLVDLDLQITSYLTAVLYIFFGIKDWVGRIIPIFFSLLAIYFFHKLAEFHSNTNIALISSFVYAILPLNLFFTRVLMSESAMMFFSMAALYFFSLYLKEPTKTYFGLSLTFITLAFLSKLPNLYLLLPLFFLAYRKNRHTDSAVLLLIAFSLAVTVSYYAYERSIAEFKLIPYNEESDWGSLVIWTDPSFYFVLFTRATTIIFTQLGIFLALYGMYLNKKQFFTVWLLSAIAYLYILAKSNYVHTQYQIVFIPIGAYYIGLAVYEFSKKSRILAYFLLFSLFILSLANVLPLYDRYAQSAFEAGIKLKELDNEDSLVLTVMHRQDIMPEALYYADRKGWSIPQNKADEKKIQEFRDMGVKYIVFTYPSAYWREYFSGKIQASSDSYLIATI